MASIARWRTDPVFSDLCDLVASDRLVCVTGAGISSTLRHAKKRGAKLPGWGKLLTTLRRNLASSLKPDEKEEVAHLLHKKASNNELIEAATVLRRGREKRFDELLREAVTHLPNATTKTHEALLEISPRGILTFNYDLAHENAIKQRGLKEQWDVFLPWEEETLHQALQSRNHRPFLLKAHGSLSSPKQLVLTYESYRELLVKYPVYRTFVQNLLINFSLLIVGFGLSDPDFDQFIQSLSLQLGAPLHPHIVIRRRYERKEETLLHHRFGIRTLYVNSFAQIPEVISEAIRQTGPHLEKTIDKCLSPKNEDRREGHVELGQLGHAGKARASNVLRTRMETYKFEVTKLSEIAYSLGKLDPHDKENKNALIKIVEDSEHVEPVAHALLALRDALKKNDLPWLKKQLRRLQKQRLKFDAAEPDPDNRIPVYLQFLICYVRAKYLEKKVPARASKSANSSVTRRRK